MRRMTLFGILFLSATVLLGQKSPPTNVTPLNAKVGAWQITQTVSWTGLPPQQAAIMKQASPTMTYKSCVKAKDLTSNPWANSHDECAWSAQSSTGTDMDVQATGCQMGKEFGMTADIHGKIHVVDSEHGTGSFDITMTGNGQTMHGHGTYTGKWIGPSCAGMD